ncbi:hypothetical protein OsJ_31038 [Oryza sativa Japonica Group]|uniref:Uncharacterized protein n=1 Tax=Oryza sativa subsp. japonica TaxID=39947 RepID=B9G7Z5_ORYSJ|nr:hypothetical protein OsJ_31038 [Oryza sativa Japonica Group]
MAAALELEAIRWGTAKFQGAGKGTHPFLWGAHRARKRRAVEAPASPPAKSRRAAPPPSRLATSRNAPWSEFIGSEIAAFIAEPVMGAGGVIAPPKTYFEKVSPYTILGMYKKCIDIL